MFYSAAFCLHECHFPGSACRIETTALSSLSSVNWSSLTRVCVGCILLMSPSQRDLSLQCQGSLCFHEGIGFHLDVKEMPHQLNLPSCWKPGWLPVVTWSSYHPPQNQVAIKQRFVNSAPAVLQSIRAAAPRCSLGFLEDGYGRQINLFFTAKAGKRRIIMYGTI